MNLMRFALLAGFCVSFCVVANAYAQDKKETPKDAAAVKAVRDAGGRVSQISAAGPEKEVNFSLASKKVDDPVLVNIAKIENVIWLNLRGTEITDGGLATIAELANLERLHLEKTKIGDAGLKHLAKMQKLKYLNLYGSQVTDAGLEHLKSLKSLKKVYVWQSKVTEEGIKNFQKAMPQLQIVGALKLTTPKVVEEGKKGEMKKDANKKVKQEKGKKAQKKK